MAANVVIRLQPGDSIEYGLKLLKRACANSGTTGEIKRHVFYNKPSLAKRLKSQRARKRLRKANRYRVQREQRED